MSRVLSEEKIVEAKKVWSMITKKTEQREATTSWLHLKPDDVSASDLWKYKGYMTQKQLLVFLQTPEGRKFCGVDCARSGTGGLARVDGIRKIHGHFISLCVQADAGAMDFIPLEGVGNGVNVKQYADRVCAMHKSVGKGRKLQKESFCIFEGFALAFHSQAFARMKSEWKEMARAWEDADKPLAQAPPPAHPSVVVGVPVEVAFTPPPPQRPNDVVEMDASDDEEEVKAPPPPPQRPNNVVAMDECEDEVKAPPLSLIHI